MQSKDLLAAAVALSAFAVADVGHAALVNAPVPSDAYITKGGLNWAWASPVAADGSFGSGAIDLSYQSQFGWRLPTADELKNAPFAVEFLVAGGNVPYKGTDPVSGAWFSVNPGSNYDSFKRTGAVASPYFNSSYYHADYDNAPGSGSINAGPWWGQPGAKGSSESLVVRGVIPEPATWAMMLAGLAALGFAACRRARLAPRAA